MKRLFEDKRGMTLTELLVALTLLMIVIVGTTPVMLSAYSSLYTAGEKTQDSYNAKSEIADTLATRNSLNVVENFKVNFQGLGEVASINGKRAVSSLENSLETIFAGGRARVAIVSSKVINDDKKSHDVILQTTNVTFKSPLDISYNTPDSVKVGGKAVDVSLYLPDKSSNALASIYAVRANTAEKGVVVTNANPATGRIYIDVNGVDFTNSPAKIEITYLDENDKVKRTSCYLTIKTPTIMAVGSTTYGDYYTTAGVETFKNPDGSTYDKLFVDARRMDIQGTKAGYTKQIPGGTVFRSVNWITEQTATTGEFVASSYEPSYYVLTGTNGAIYRTYSFKEYNTSFVGKINLSVSSADTAAFTQKYHQVISQSGQDVLGIADSIYTLDDAQSTVVYPAVWGGDFSHIYGYSTHSTVNGYLGTDNWYTEDGDTGKGQQGYYSNFANFGYYYNGYGMSFSYYTQNSLKASYILTERENALRVGGLLGASGSYDGKYNRIWERLNTWDPVANDWEKQEIKKKIDAMTAYYYKSNYSMPTLSRCTIVSGDGDIKNYTNKVPNDLPTYFIGGTGIGRPDNGFAQLRIKASTTISPSFAYDRWAEVDSDGFDGQLSSVKFVTNASVNKPQIAVTDAVYIPATSTTPGGVFYVGTVAAYTLLYQTDAFGGGANDADRIYNNGSDSTGSTTSYFLAGNADGETTTVVKWSSPIKGIGNAETHTYNRQLMSTAFGSPYTVAEAKADGVYYSMNTNESRQFFIPPSTAATRGDSSYKKVLFDDVKFTMGFASNREMVYSQIVYGNVKRGNSTVLEEAQKSFEPYYFLSHYDDSEHVPNLYMNNTVGGQQLGDRESDPWIGSGSDGNNSSVTNPTTAYKNAVDNDYYNVWFPGEMYNLTKVATKDGVTVSVGYAVSGSTYTWINSSDTTNSSTALGSIYNDGVLAAMVSGQDSSFTNLLYFKDRSKFDNSSLKDYNAGYTSTFSEGYGTHGRDSVQFTCVDISIEYTKSGNTENATYYAYYADNKGRLYKSKVATKSTTVGGASSTPQLVSHIADEPYDGTRGAPSYMEQIYVNGNPVGDYFSKITTVSCEGNYIIVGGHSKDSNFNLVIGTIQQSADQLSNTVTWKLVKISEKAACQLEDALILDGYVYLAGVSVKNLSHHKGFIYAISLEDINRIESGGFLPFNPNLFVGDDQLQDRIYAI
ncbi:MAG: prepilin-type N-terminal cleavage/methylation domain-containing protein, partial [Clostridia bacterium]|nr:prepilin-type N-terminal cleavage/methylation domain-containing protein [Clostridia bacterium]